MDQLEITAEMLMSPEREHYQFCTPYISFGETSGAVDHSHHNDEQLKQYNRVTVYFFELCLFIVNITIAYHVLKQE